MLENIIADYHERQFKTPYRSTIAFDEFLSARTNLEGVKVLDLACGGGANEYYFAKKYKQSKWTGIDIDPRLFALFYKYSDELPNVYFAEGNWLDLDSTYKGEFDGVISLQSLSWLPEWERPMAEICKIEPKWIAMSSLFYEGDIEYMIKLKNYERLGEKGACKESYYNIYALPRIERFLKDRGYDLYYEPFEIDIDIPKPDSKDIGTYTIKTEAGKRLQISAALMLPWYFIYAERNGCLLS